VVHEGQGLALGLEAGDDLAAVHAGLDDLDGDLALHGLGLLGHEDGAHAALGDLLQELVLAHDPARGILRVRACHGRARGRRHHRFGGGPFQEAVLLVVHGQEGLDAALQGGILPAGLAQVLAAGFRRRDMAGDVENRLFPGVRQGHGAPRRARTIAPLRYHAKTARGLPNACGI
jgi:hypothetical protein